MIWVYRFSMADIRWVSRWSREQIRAMLLEQFQSFWQRDTGIERTLLAQLERAAAAPHAVISLFRG